MLELVRGPRVLDVGCTDHVVRLGRPEWLHGRLRDRFDDVVGVDISAENIDKMRDAGFDNLFQQSAEELSLGGVFDTIVAGELIEHLSNPGRFLDRALQHLAPEGRIVLSTPYPFALPYLAYAVAKYPHTCQNDEHVTWFCPRTIEGLGRRHGLRVEHLELVEDLDLNDPSRPYRLMVRANRVLRHVLPKRLTRNTMVLTLVRA